MVLEICGGEFHQSYDKIDLSNDIFNNISKFIEKPTKILDVGCAFGASIYALKDKFKEASFCGIDSGKETIQTANENVANEKISFVNGFSHKLPYKDATFDVIIFFNGFCNGFQENT